MRMVLQRVQSASLTADGILCACIKKGLAVYVGIGPQDDEKIFAYMIDKVNHLRIFEDENEKLNLSVEDIGGEVLYISNFTLYGDCRHGRRPSYSTGAPVEQARKLYEEFCRMASDGPVKASFGVFQADMQIHQHVDGPVTLMIDSDKVF